MLNQLQKLSPAGLLGGGIGGGLFGLFGTILLEIREIVDYESITQALLEASVMSGIVLLYSILVGGTMGVILSVLISIVAWRRPIAIESKQSGVLGMVCGALFPTMLIIGSAMHGHYGSDFLEGLLSLPLGLICGAIGGQIGSKILKKQNALAQS